MKPEWTDALVQEQNCSNEDEDSQALEGNREADSSPRRLGEIHLGGGNVGNYVQSIAKLECLRVMKRKQNHI